MSAENSPVCEEKINLKEVATLLSKISDATASTSAAVLNKNDEFISMNATLHCYAFHQFVSGVGPKLLRIFNFGDGPRFSCDETALDVRDLEEKDACCGYVYRQSGTVITSQNFMSEIKSEIINRKNIPLPTQAIRNLSEFADTSDFTQLACPVVEYAESLMEVLQHKPRLDFQVLMVVNIFELKYFLP